MKISKTSDYEKIIRESILQVVKTIPYVESISNTMLQDRHIEKKNDKSILIDFLPKNRISILIHVVLYHTNNLTIPEIVYEIQEKVQSSLNNLIKFEIRNIDVSVTGVLI